MDEENDCLVCYCGFPICMLFPERGKGCLVNVSAVVASVSVEKNTASVA